MLSRYPVFWVTAIYQSKRNLKKASWLCKAPHPEVGFHRLANISQRPNSATLLVLWIKLYCNYILFICLHITYSHTALELQQQDYIVTSKKKYDSQSYLLSGLLQRHLPTFSCTSEGNTLNPWEESDYIHLGKREATKYGEQTPLNLFLCRKEQFQKHLGPKIHS